ncbi:OmpA family protein [Myxococcus sp. MISCRS1]|uniref:OmpA family protein n=1 Tax=Myxococcus sp. MISCRS1 TaxID=2996786 RepID=UPI00226E96B5|nr:OmpA family protein [Myxococcus sp. MISCRS1]MCY0996391.1 OmpA family protein [Myxococcus sp. MISCRS1]
MLATCLLLLASLVSGSAGAEPVATGDAWLELAHDDRLSQEGFWELVSVDYTLDGRTLPSTGAAGPRHVLPLGLRWLDVSVVYEGRSSVFSYVDAYRFVMRGRVTIDARPGDTVRVTSTAYERDGVTLHWQQRPAFMLLGQPQEAIVGIEYGPVVNTPLPDEVAARVVDEVLAEARRLSPERPATASIAEVVAPAVSCELEPVFFAFFDTRLSAEGEASLLRAAECLHRGPRLRVRLRGHADILGPESVNASLGLGRAQSVAAKLQALGIEGARLVLETQGADLPPCNDGTPGCMARSRRVELLVESSPP